MYRDGSKLAYTANFGLSSTNFPIIEERDPTDNDVNYQVGKFWINTTDQRIWYLNSQSNVKTASNPSGNLQSDWVQLDSVSTDDVLSLSDDLNVETFPDVNGNIQLVGHLNEQGSTKFSTVTAGTSLLNINPMSGARWIVDPLGFNGTHTTIAGAIASATSGDTILVMASATSYTENLTLKAGVNIVAYQADAFTPNVTIVGKLTCTYTGAVTISGIKLQTNADFGIESTGSNAARLNLYNCLITASNNTFLSSSNSNFSCSIEGCTGGLLTTGIAYFAMTAGVLFIFQSVFNNSGASTTANTFSGTGLSIRYSVLSNPITTSGASAVFTAYFSTFDNSSLNAVCVTHNSTAANTLMHSCEVRSGTATPIVIGAGAAINAANLLISSSNAASISNSGTFSYAGIDFVSTIGTINGTITSRGTLGNLAGTAPVASSIGERIVSAVSVASAVALATNTAANMTSISLTPGIWDITMVGGFTSPTVTPTLTQARISINTVSATLSLAVGDSDIIFPVGIAPVTGVADSTMVLPTVRALVTTTTTYYGVARAIFSAGDISAYGRLSAVRVA